MDIGLISTEGNFRENQGKFRWKSIEEAIKDLKKTHDGELDHSFFKKIKALLLKKIERLEEEKEKEISLYKKRADKTMSINPKTEEMKELYTKSRCFSSESYESFKDQTQIQLLKMLKKDVDKKEQEIIDNAGDETKISKLKKQLETRGQTIRKILDELGGDNYENKNYSSCEGIPDKVSCEKRQGRGATDRGPYQQKSDGGTIKEECKWDSQRDMKLFYLSNGTLIKNIEIIDSRILFLNEMINMLEKKEKNPDAAVESLLTSIHQQAREHDDIQEAFDRGFGALTSGSKRSKKKRTKKKKSTKKKRTKKKGTKKKRIKKKRTMKRTKKRTKKGTKKKTTKRKKSKK